MTDLGALYKKIVSAGLASKKFKIFGRGEHKAASLADCTCLYNFVLKLRISDILEVGTWFGTTAMFMAQAMKDNGIDGCIYTCDKHDMYLDWPEYRDVVRFKNMEASKLIGRLRKKWKCDMVFADGRLYQRDCDRLVGMYKGPVCFVAHDWSLRKGQNNYKYMRKALGKRPLTVTHLTGECYTICST